MLPLIVLANRCTSPNRRSRRLRWSACWPSCRPRCALVVWFVIWPLCSSSMKRWLKANAPRCVSIRYKWEAQDFVKQRNVIELLKRIFCQKSMLWFLSQYADMCPYFLHLGHWIVGQSALLCPNFWQFLQGISGQKRVGWVWKLLF